MTHHRLRRATTWCVLSAFVVTLPGAPAFAELVGEQVVKGKATIERDGNHTHITTRTKNTIIDYKGFDIEQDETVRIDQPNARSRILNRVSQGDRSRIEGGLSSNGIVYILNPAGVFIGDRAVVDVSGLVAGAASMTNRDFMKHVDRFSDVSGDVNVAEGASIRAAGNIALIGRHVQNLGSVESRKGTIALVAGEDVVLAPLDGNILVRVDGGPPASDAADPARFGIEQGGELSAQRVVLAAGDQYSLAMNHTGVTHAVHEIRAQAGEDGLAQVAGRLDVSNDAAGKQGGRIELRAGKIALLHATLDASGAAGGGEILVGGDVRGSGAGTTADRVYVSPDAKLAADALEDGDGGKIVIYADERTAFYGELSARGGAAGGDGGFAEISGARLEARGEVDLGAPQGKAGTLLYDPNEIVIRGGVGNGSDDEGTPDTVVGDDGTAGEVISGDVGNGETPFEIFESEIEGTDANIILEATNRIETAGNFEGEGVDGEVTLQSGRSLTLRTTGNAANSLPSEQLGIDLTADGNETLAWRVRDGANILIETNLDTSTVGTDPKASIKVGKLISEGAAYLDQVDGASAAAPVTTPRAIVVQAGRGDVEVTSVNIDGDLAKAKVENGPGTEDDVPARVASAGGNVTISSQQGDVTVGDPADNVNPAISAKGGSATAEQPSLGARGGTVNIVALDGSVSVRNVIDVSGGVGFGTPTFEGTPITSFSQGGAGGQIGIDAKGANGSVFVTDDLLAVGGEGRAVNDPDLSDDVFDAVGAAGGVISIAADVNTTVGTESDGVLLDASSGDGSAAGGSAAADVASVPIQVIGARVAAAEGGDERIVTVHAELRAKGGNGGRPIGVADAESETGGAGGRGGNVTVAANTGTLNASGMSIDASGGNGELTLDPLSNRPRTLGGLALVASGAGGTVIARADHDIHVGSITSKGGNATHASAGDDSGTTDGGSVSITTLDGDVTVGRVDVSGGSVDPLDALEDAGVRLGGGDAGSVSIVPRPSDDPDVPLNGVGDVTIGAVDGVDDSVGGIGGTGRDADGTTFIFGAGARVDVLADRVNGEIRANADARFRGGFVTLEGARIGSASERVQVSGTDADGDIAVYTVFDQLHGEIGNTAGEKLEQVRVVVRDEEAEAHLHTAGGTELLDTAGVDPTHTTHTIESMKTTDDDPRIAYRLFVLPDPDPDDNPGTPDGESQPDLAIARGAVNLGAAGGEIANDSGSSANEPATNRGKIIDAGTGSGAHVTSTGDVRIEGLSIGSETSPIQFASAENDDGDPTAALTLDVLGTIDAQLSGGDARYGAIEILQSDAINGDVRIDDLNRAGLNEIQIVGGGVGGSENISRIVRADTSDGAGGDNSAFAYRLVAPNDATLKVDEVVLGGSGLLLATGDVVLTNDFAGAGKAAVTANGNNLTLIGDDIVQEGSGIELAMGGAASDPAALIFSSDSFGTSETARIVSSGLKQIAGLADTGGVFLTNSDSDLSIQRVVNPNPTDLNQDATADTANNLGAPQGDVDVVNTNGKIVLGALLPDAEFQREHIVAGDDVKLSAAAGIEINNAHFVKTPVPGVGDVFTAVNDAKITSIGGDIVMNGPIDTQAGATAVSDEATNPPDPEQVHAKLMLNAPKGTSILTGDVGARGDADAPLALLETVGGLRLEASDPLVPASADRRMVLADARFGGRIDGPGALKIEAQDLAHQVNAADVASVAFAGDIGAGTALKGLDVSAEQIQFTSADRVVTGDGGVALTTHQTGIPTVATISDTGGGLRIQTTGNFSVGDLDAVGPIHIDKLTSAGPLSIKANEVDIADVNATQLSIEANEIRVYARAPGQVTRADGTTPADLDTGTDIVADSMRFNVVPEIVGPGATPRLGLGSGGIRAPGSMRAFDVVRFTSQASGVEPGLMFGVDGQVLDLTPTGGTIVGNPTQDLERIRPTPEPELQAQPSDEQPTPAPSLTAEQVLAYLRCGTDSGPSDACDADDHAPLAAVGNWQESAFATPRAGELAADYRAMRQRDLSAAFDQAAAGFRAQSGFGEFDSERFAEYLETSPDAADARQAIHDFAELLVGVDLLGLSQEQSERLHRELAAELAAEADLPGFDADAVLAAVAKTPIGLPPQSER